MVPYGAGPEMRTWASPAPRDPATTPRELRRWNAGVVLDALRRTDVATVADLVGRTGLSRPTVNAAVDELLGVGLVAERAPDAGQEPRRGRPGRRLAFRSDRGFLLALDIGECTVRAAVADLRGSVLAERRLPFPDPSRGGTHRIPHVRDLVAEVLAAAGVGRDLLMAAAVGVSGGIDPATGLVAYSGALPAGLDLADALDLPCTVLAENDANLAALAESWQGGAQGVSNVICVLAGERLGAGLVVNGQLVRGHEGAAGEMAFLGPFAEDTGAEGISQWVRNLAAEESGAEPSSVDAAAVFAAAAAGDPGAVDVVDRAVAAPARATATLALVLDPQLVVVGGAVARAGETLLAPFRRHVSSMTRVPPTVIASPLAERGVLLGAVRRALDHVEAHLLDGLAGDPLPSCHVEGGGSPDRPLVP